MAPFSSTMRVGQLEVPTHKGSGLANQTKSCIQHAGKERSSIVTVMSWEPAAEASAPPSFSNPGSAPAQIYFRYLFSLENWLLNFFYLNTRWVKSAEIKKNILESKIVKIEVSRFVFKTEN